ncbi:uncharacterized protein TNCV_4342941 [Trichonephila clavipes]|nr:uncharacterized protein TNCV_4342941 [Trichonephila clavipes]
MDHKNQYRSRKGKFTGNQYKNKRSSIDSQAKNDTTVASNIELKTVSTSKLEDLKDNFLENSGNSDEIFGHRIFVVTTLLSVIAVLCCPVCLHDELSLTEDSRVIGKGYTTGNKLFGILDLPFLSKTAFRNQELKIQLTASIVSIESMKNAETGTWQKRGYSSHNGCISCISIDTGNFWTSK